MAICVLADLITIEKREKANLAQTKAFSGGFDALAIV